MSSTTKPNRHTAARVLRPVRAREELEQFAFDDEPDRAFADVALRKTQHVTIEAPLRLQVIANDANPNRPTQLPNVQGGQFSSLRS